jgi:hypothetical protein
LHRIDVGFAAFNFLEVFSMRKALVMIFLQHGFGGFNNKISFAENILFVC